VDSQRRRTRNRLTYLHRNQIGSPVNIRGGEAEQSKAGAHEAILPAVVINHPFAVIAAVVFDSQALGAIEQVGAS
jgi:hypothetical protein